MIAMTPTRIPKPGVKGNPTRHRKPDPHRFATLVLRLPAARENGVPYVQLAITAVLAAGVAFGGIWNRDTAAAVPKDEIFVMEEEIPLPPPEPPPPPPDPEPPPPKAAPEAEPPPPPRFGLEDDALGEAGDLAVAAGNTVMKEPDPIVAPAPPPLPAAPVFVDQAPKILAGDPPEYPARALDRGLEGTVVALITIDTNGTVTGVSIEKSAGADFDGAVIKAARLTRFQPPVRDGRKVPARFRRPFEFGLE
jgi:periplasmic protein TonB